MGAFSAILKIIFYCSMLIFEELSNCWRKNVIIMKLINISLIYFFYFSIFPNSCTMKSHLKTNCLVMTPYWGWNWEDDNVQKCAHLLFQPLPCAVLPRNFSGPFLYILWSLNITNLLFLSQASMASLHF